MARESQGLQVLLIVFVMLTVVLGVTTYLYCKRADEATKAVAAANSGKQQVETEKKDVEKERDDLKRWIGFPTNSTEEIHKQVDEDMQAFGNEKKPDAGTEKAGATNLPPTPAPSATTIWSQACTRLSRTVPTSSSAQGALWPIWKRDSRTARPPRIKPSKRSPQATPPCKVM